MWTGHCRAPLLPPVLPSVLHSESKERGRGRERVCVWEWVSEREREWESGFGSPTSLTGPVSINLNRSSYQMATGPPKWTFFLRATEEKIHLSVRGPLSLSLSLSEFWNSLYQGGLHTLRTAYQAISFNSVQKSSFKNAILFPLAALLPP